MKINSEINLKFYFLLYYSNNYNRILMITSNIQKYLKRSILVSGKLIGLATVLQKILYLNEKSIYFHPIWALFQMKLTKTNKSNTNSSNNYHKMLLTVIMLLSRLIISLNQMETNMNTMTTNTTNNPFINKLYPNSNDKMIPGLIYPPNRNGLCPICRNKCIDPTVSPGGFVYCYLCIVQELNNNTICPVSGLYCDANQLIRLYVSE